MPVPSAKGHAVRLCRCGQTFRNGGSGLAVGEVLVGGGRGKRVRSRGKGTRPASPCRGQRRSPHPSSRCTETPRTPEVPVAPGGFSQVCAALLSPPPAASLETVGHVPP